MTTHPLTGKRVLVTGGDGTIGTAVCDRLARIGAQVTVLSLSREPAPPGAGHDDHDDVASRPPSRLDPPRPRADRILHGSATDPTVVADALDNADLVVHLAAIAHPSLAPAPQLYRTNVVSTFNVLWQAGERGIRRAVIASSINATGIPFNSHDALPAYYPVDERLPVDHDDAYSLSKYADEATARMIHRHWSVDVAALRFPHVTDAESLRARSQDFSTDPGTGVSEGWSYLDVRDAARAVELGLTAGFSGADPVLVAADDTLVPYPTEDLLDRYAPAVPRTQQFVGREVPIDLTAARTLLGFRAQHPINPGDLSLPDYSENGCC